jgi:hypothetical protein
MFRLVAPSGQRPLLLISLLLPAPDTNLFNPGQKTILSRGRSDNNPKLLRGVIYMTENDTPQDTGSESNTAEVTGDTSSLELSGGITLEQIVDLTGELVHLNQLILLHIEKCGGFTTHDAYFIAIQPVLDLLEVEVRYRYHSGMTTQEMKLVVQDWIDCEIAALHKSC